MGLSEMSLPETWKAFIVACQGLFLLRGTILHSAMITSSPLISPFHSVPQNDFLSSLWSCRCPPKPWQKQPPAICRNTLPSRPAPRQPPHGPCPHRPGCNCFLYLCLPPFLCLFALASRSRAASCNIFCATCILTSASSNLCLWWVFSMSRLSADRISFFAPVPRTSSNPAESHLYWLVILGFPVLRSLYLQAI